LQPAQVIEETRIEQRFAIIAALRAKVIDFRVGEAERAQEIDHCCQPASHRELPGKRVFPKGDVKHCLMIHHPRFEITARHRDLVKVSR
jgi:hypothetical protein